MAIREAWEAIEPRALALFAATDQTMLLPGIARHLKYKNSAFCARLIEMYLGIKTVVRPGGCVTH
ncbi:MAG: hypothetical protein ACFHX7_11515 [Pseudomonadota bacterium]